MRNQSTPTTPESRVGWETLEDFVRGHVQTFVQRILEEEVSERLGRSRSQRRSQVDPEPGYRNGYGKPRKLTLSNGTISIRRPRVRGLSERFQSRILPLFQRQTREVSELLPELYLHGLAEGDFDLALRGLLGEGAPLSASSIARLKVVWQAEYEAWKGRSLAELEVVYLWVDGVYVKAGLEKDKAAVLVAVAALRDGRKVVVAVESGARESTASWSALLRDLKERGMSSLVLARAKLRWLVKKSILCALVPSQPLGWKRVRRRAPAAPLPQNPVNIPSPSADRHDDRESPRSGHSLDAAVRRRRG